ncbi:8892_t:CDS:2 [Funneliformis geosporum]|nr:8892_t:CDS:2 [Funneliformis geosporum]
MVNLKSKSMEDKKGRTCDNSNDWCSQGGINQKHEDYPGRAKTHSKRTLPISKMFESPYTTPHPPLANENLPVSDVTVQDDKKHGLTSSLAIAAIIIGLFIISSIVIYGLIRFVRKRKNNSASKPQEQEVRLPTNHLTITIDPIKHNHYAQESCTTPDTRPILDYYSSKAGLALNPSSLGNNNSKNSARSNNPNFNYNNDEYTTVEINENTTTTGDSTKEFSGENDTNRQRGQLEPYSE